MFLERDLGRHVFGLFAGASSQAHWFFKDVRDALLSQLFVPFAGQQPVSMMTGMWGARSLK